MSQATALLADAESSIASGAWDQALQQLESIKQSEPQEPDVYRRLSHVLAVRGRFRAVVQTYVELAAVLLEQDQLSEAEGVVGTVLALHPECEEAREKRIEIEKRRGNTDRAVYLARELARLCIEQGDGDRSIRLLQDAQKAQPENLDISLELAEMFVSHGQIQDGANQYRKVANAFQEAGNISKAAEAYRRMKVVQSDDPDVLLTLGRLYTELGKLDEAEQEFRSVLRHDLEHQDALLELGLVCQLKGRFRSGLLAFNKVLQNNPKLPKAMRKLGELNLSMGKQAEAVQHFLEAAQAYLEVEEREEAVDVFQIVLGVDEGNAQAQQGLTNLGAPLEPKEFEPPLPPTPPEEEPPTPEPAPVSAMEIPPPAASSAAESRTPGGGGKAASTGSKGARKGLVAGGLLRKGLVDPSSGVKPMMGGKPTLGGAGGSTRAGLRRPGLGMKGGPGGSDKPMMGMGGIGMGKPTLGRRRSEPESEAEHEVQEEPVFDAPEEEPMESLFDDDGGDTGDGLEDDFANAAGDLFDQTSDSPFDEGLGDSLFAPDLEEKPGAEPVSSSGIGLEGAGELDFSPGTAASNGEAADDLFDMAGAQDLFDDDGGASGSLFDDDALPSADLFDDGAGGGLFDDAPAPAVSPREVAQSSPAEDLFGGEQFDSLFDEADGDNLSVSDTIGTMKAASSAEVDLFGEPAPADEVEESGFESLFGDEPGEAGGRDDGEAAEDLFSTRVEPAEASGPNILFDDDEESGSDLFDDDLFSVEPEPEAREDAGASDATLSSGDLFSEPMEAEDAGGLFGELEEEPAQPLEEAFPGERSEGAGGLFEESGEADDLFGGGGLFAVDDDALDSASEVEVAPREEFDLFSDPAEDEQTGEEEALSPAAGGDLFSGFGAEEEAGDDIFGGSSPQELFEDSSPASGLFDDQAPADELFGGPELAEPLRETAVEFDSQDTAPLDQAFDGGETEAGLFDIPDPTDDPGLFEEPVTEEPGGHDSLFDAEEPDGSGGLFDDLAEGPDAPSPLGLDLPMPGDPPLQPQEPESEPEPEPEPSGGLFDEIQPEELPHEDGLTLDKLRAELAPPEVESPPTESSDSAEFMKLLEMTLPKTEEEKSEEQVEEEPIAPVEGDSFDGDGGGGLFEEPSAEAVSEGGLFEQAEDDLFAPEPEPEPVDEGPEILGKPKVSLSIEDESPTTDIERADQLDAGLAGADVAAKIAAYRKALEESPDNLVMRTRLADIHLKYGMLEDALVQYRQVMRRNTESISLLHRVIQAEFWTENYAEAGESLLLLAKLHLKRGEHHDALDTLQSVLSLDSHHFEARKVLVSVFTSLNEDKLAAHHLRQLAETALTKGEVNEAIAAFQQLLDISNDPVFEERLAQIYESQGDMERALKSFQRLVGRYQEEERWEEAARVTERIVELNPDLLEDRGALVELYKKLGMNEKAMEQQFKLARLYQEKGQLDSAITLYEGVLEHQPENQDARRSLVDAYLDSNAVPSALEQAEALTEYYLHTKDHQTAIDLYSRLVEADPENVELQERLVKFYGLAGDPENAKVRWIGLADLHERRERYGKAAEAIQKALELDEGQVDLQHRLALLFAERLSDKVAALGQLRKLFQLAPERLDAVKMYIDILLEQEQVAEAGQVLQQLEQAGGESVAIKNDVIASLKNQVESNPFNLKTRFNYGELCYHLSDLDHAIEQFQQTRRNPDYELMSYNMLGLCFAKKRGFNMLDLAIKQFKKGLETKGHNEQAYLELRYNLAMIQYQNGRLAESLSDFKECYRVDITYRDVRSWIEKIESELASSGA